MLRWAAVVHPSPASRQGIQGASHGVRSEVRVQRHRRGCPPGRERLLRPRLRRRLPQTPDADGGRTHTTMNRLHCDNQLQGCQLGHMLPEHPKTMWLVLEDTVRSPDVSAWKSAVYDGLRSAGGFHVLSVDGTMKSAMGVRRRDAGTPLTSESSQQDTTWTIIRAC